MQTFKYELELRIPTSPRMRSGKGMSYMDPIYRVAQYDLRKTIIETYGRFETIEPTKHIKAAPTRGREEQLPYRNVLLHFCATLTENSGVDTDNVAKFLTDTLGPMSQRQLTKKDQELEWVPLYRNDRQVIGGDQNVVDQWGVNHLQFVVVRLDSPKELAAYINDWPFRIAS